jgi:hypothetical protein
MTRILIAILITLTGLLAGCASWIDGRASGERDASYPLQLDTPIRLEAAGDDAHQTLRSRRYLDAVAEALRRWGFLNVSTEADARAPAAPVKARLALSTQSGTYEYDSPEYNETESSYEVCDKDKNGKRRCHTHTRTTRTLAGYSRKTAFYTDYQVRLTWTDARTARPVMSTLLVSRNPPCTEDVNFQTLIDAGMPALGWDQVGNRPFRVQVERKVCRPGPA